MADNEPYGFAELRRELAAQERAKAKQAQKGKANSPFALFKQMSDLNLMAATTPPPPWIERIRKPLQYDWEIQAGDRERLNKWKQGQDFHPPTEGFWSHQTSLGKSPQEIDSLWDQTPDREKDEWFNKREFDKELQSQGASEPRPTTPYQAPMREAAEARASSGEIGPRPSPTDRRFGALAAPEPKTINKTAVHRPLPPAFTSGPVANKVSWASSDQPPSWYKMMEELDRALKGPYYLRNYPAVSGE